MHERARDGYSRPTQAAFEIALVLAGGAAHGYAIMHGVEKLTGRPLGPATLYRTIQRMVADGLIEELDVPAGEDLRRRPYRLTRRGRVVARREATRLVRLTEAAARCRLLARP
jgi:DNA-binding PadR family transcriptional regulator